MPDEGWHGACISSTHLEMTLAPCEEAAAVWNPTTAMWLYTATSNLAQGQAVSIEVNATTDRPGHKTNGSRASN